LAVPENTSFDGRTENGKHTAFEKDGVGSIEAKADGTSCGKTFQGNLRSSLSGFFWEEVC